MSTDDPRGLPKHTSQLQLCPPALVSLPAWAPTPQPAALPSLHKALLEEASEGLTLVALDLAMLDSPALQEVVHLCGVDGSRPLLVLGRGLAYPVVDVIGQVAARLVDLERGILSVPRPWAPTSLVWSPMHTRLGYRQAPGCGPALRGGARGFLAPPRIWLFSSCK